MKNIGYIEQDKGNPGTYNAGYLNFDTYDKQMRSISAAGTFVSDYATLYQWIKSHAPDAHIFGSFLIYAKVKNKLLGYPE